jgi:hypothetical protein
MSRAVVLAGEIRVGAPTRRGPPPQQPQQHHRRRQQQSPPPPPQRRGQPPLDGVRALVPAQQPPPPQRRRQPPPDGGLRLPSRRNNSPASIPTRGFGAGATFSERLAHGTLPGGQGSRKSRRSTGLHRSGPPPCRVAGPSTIRANCGLWRGRSPTSGRRTSRALGSSARRLCTTFRGLAASWRR